MPRYRAIFISDVHLGTPECQASRLLDFLRVIESDFLYLVGNIVDGRQLKRRFYWHQTHNDVVQKLLRKARKGTNVAYVTGSHDEAPPHFLGLAFGGIQIVEEAVHVTVDGRRLLVTHGGQFDRAERRSAWPGIVARRLRALVPAVGSGSGTGHGARRASANAAEDASRIAAYGESLAREALRRRFDGVVCGHIRNAEIREIDGALYCNDGDWVENLTAIAELESGEFRIIDWKTIDSAARYGVEMREPDEA